MNIQFKNKWKWIALPVLIVLVALTLGFSPNRITVNGQGFLSISSNLVLSAEISLSEDDIKEAALDEYEGSYISEKTLNQYAIEYSGTGSKVSIGDIAKTIVFKPDLEISHWNGEVSFKLIAPVSMASKTLTTSLDGFDDKLTASNSDWTFEYKATEPIVGFNEYGGIDLFITAKVKPASNKIYFTYDSSTATPYYQPPLTDEYRDGWSDEFNGEIKVTETQVLLLTDEKGVPLKEPQVVCERPDYVVGSIAFYADGKANHALGGINYATGKIGQLYAMRANGQWCRWTIEGDYLVLTIPYDVFDKAVYPVTIAPVGDTFGYTSNPGTVDYDIISNDFYGTLLTGAAGTADSISIYAKGGSSITTRYLKGMLCLQSDLTIVANGVGGAVAMPLSGSSYAWCESTFGTSPNISAIAYLVGGILNAGGYGGYDIVDGWTRYVDTSNDYTTPQNLGSATTTASRRFGAYCTFTPSGGFDISNTPSTENLGILAASTTYYAFGSAPSNPVDDSECTFTITNNAAGACDLDMKVADFTGGVGWNIGAPGENQARITAYYSGQNPASGLVLANTDAEFYDGLAGSATLKWDFKLESPTSMTDGVQKSAILTITAVSED